MSNTEEEELEEILVTNVKFDKPDADVEDAKIKKLLGEFQVLMTSLSTTEERKKALWRQIYENALMDRRNSFLMYGDLLSMVLGDNANHAVHGATLSKYMERMSKANDQLIKLADPVSEAVDEETAEQEWTDDEMYDKLSKAVDDQKTN